MGMNNCAYLFYGVEISNKSKDLENLQDILDKRDDFEIIFLGWWDPPHNHGQHFIAYKKSIVSGEAQSLSNLKYFDWESDEELFNFCQEYKIQINGLPQWWVGASWSV